MTSKDPFQPKPFHHSKMHGGHTAAGPGNIQQLLDPCMGKDGRGKTMKTRADVEVLPYLHGAAKHSIFLHILRLQQLQKREETSSEKCMIFFLFLLPYNFPSVSLSSLAFDTSRRKGHKIRKKGESRLSTQKFKVSSGVNFTMF